MFVTFYSYKGGVGRSMALANIACLLAEDAEHPQRVLLWDFDLEAPGLHRIFPPRQPVRFGFLDMAFEYAKGGGVPDVKEYIYSSEIPMLDVLPAGRVDDTYCQRLEQMNWPGLFTEDATSPGAFFGGLIEAIRRLEYDYVLIDSRTGLNDHASICTQVLPDLVLVIFRLTEQNIDGLEHLVPAMRTQLNARGRRGVPVVPLASAVTPNASQGTISLRQRAERMFDVGALDYIRFDADLAGEERLYARRGIHRDMWPKPVVVDDYERISEKIRSYNERDTRTATAAIRRRMTYGDYASAVQLLAGLLSRRPNSAQLWDEVARVMELGAVRSDELTRVVNGLIAGNGGNPYKCEYLASQEVAGARSADDPRLELAVKYLREAIVACPDSPGAYRALQYVCSCRGDLESALKAWRKLRELLPQNLEVRTEGIDLLIRRGTNYFALALDELGDLPPGAGFERDVRVAYLSAALGMTERATAAYESALQESGSQRVVFELHFWLACGKVERALARADAVASKRRIALANLIEFYICAGRLDRAAQQIQVAQTAARGVPSDAKAAGLLARYLEGAPDGPSENDVVEAWSDMQSWSFLELLMFRERARSDARLSGRVSVVERLIRGFEFAQRALRLRYVQRRTLRRGEAEVLASGE